VPYEVAGLLAVAASVAVRLLTRAAGRWLTPLGLLAMVVGLCSVRVVVPSADGLVLTVPFTLLAVGAAVALTAAWQEVGAGAAVFGLSLCLAGVLAGFLLGTGVQMAMLDGVTSAQQLVDSFVGALHWWSLVGGFLVVAVIVLAAVMARRPVKVAPVKVEVPCAGSRASGDVLLVQGPADDDVRGSRAAVESASASSGSVGTAAEVADSAHTAAGVAGSVGTAAGVAGSAGGFSGVAGSAEALGGDAGSVAARRGGAEDDDAPTGVVPRVVLPVSAFDQAEPAREEDAASEPAGTPPAVPPQAHSPEDPAGS
ncbi:hypothetical protein, partial [Nonomuraea sp. NPDC002799]